MKLITAIIHERDKQKIGDTLLRAGHKFTNIATRGGFLRDGNCTLLIGSEDDQVDEIIETIKTCCHAREQYINQTPIDVLGGSGMLINPVKVSVGGAVIFVTNVERFEHV